MAACAAPLVGLLGERVFGFRGKATATRDPAIDQPNAAALGNALLAFLLVPWCLTLLLYSGKWFRVGLPVVGRGRHGGVRALTRRLALLLHGGAQVHAAADRACVVSHSIARSSWSLCSPAKHTQGCITPTLET